MPSPPIQVFLTTIASQPALRQRQEYILRILQVKKIPFTSYDLASDEDAKKLWRRKAPNDKQQLPGILVGGRFPGPFSDFEDAVEHDELTTFLRLNDDWDPEIDGDGKELKPAAPVGVPGAASPMQMRPDHKPSFAAQRPPLTHRVVSNRRHPDDPQEYDAGDKLDDKALAGVQVTEDELMQLVADLGLGGAEADDLVKGLSEKPKDTPAAPEPTPAAPAKAPAIVEPETVASAEKAPASEPSQEDKPTVAVSEEAAPTEAVKTDKPVEPEIARTEKTAEAEVAKTEKAVDAETIKTEKAAEAETAKTEKADEAAAPAS